MTNPLIVPVDGRTLDWPRRVANAFRSASGMMNGQAASITALQSASTSHGTAITALQTDAATRLHYPFESLASAPSTPAEGRTYYDTTTHKAMTWDGTTWQPHW